MSFGDRVSDALSALERPEYTGENRCLPCTAVNVAIGIALAAGVTLAVSPFAGALALAVCLVLVYLRGYLVPGTPALTRQYLPEGVLAAFGKAPATGPTVESVTPAELAAVLTAADVATDRGNGLRLTDAFRARWDERLSSTSSDGAADPDAEAVGSALGVDDVERVGDASFELEGRKRIGWESTAALRADVAAAAELRTRLAGWNALEVAERRDVLTGLRLLRTRCPACDAPVATTVDRLEHCCRRPRVGVRAACEACDRTLVELVAAESRAEPWLELAGATGAVEADD